MADSIIEHLKSLHTNAIDARKGYEEALADADGRGLTGRFRAMIGLHATNADELAGELGRMGEHADSGGSFMSTLHRTIMSVRGLFGGLDESVLPGLIDGERRNVSYYDEALAEPSLAPDQRTLLAAQRERLQAAVAEMQAEKV